MRLNKYLTEIKMTKKTKFYDTAKKSWQWSTKFKVDDFEYEVYVVENEKDMWEMGFRLTDKSLDKMTKQRGTDYTNPYTLTNLGNPIPVFKGVLQGLKKWWKQVDKNKIKSLGFTAETWEYDDEMTSASDFKKRMRIYKKGAPMIEKITGMKFLGVTEPMKGIYQFDFENPDYET